MYSGGIKIKVGPVTSEYKGSAEFVEKDEDNHKAVIKGKGRDVRGAGNAEALITATMMAVGEKTQVDIHTDLKVSGKVAQFGRGVMQDVSTKLLGQFADCLETKISEPETIEDVAAASAAAAGGAAPQHAAAASDAPSADAPPAGSSTSSSSSDDDEVLDLGDIGLGKAMAKQAAPAVGALLGLFVLLKLFRKLGKSS